MENYEIIVRGYLDPLWEDWFGDIKIEACPDGTTRISGALPDQPALRAVLERIFDLNLELLVVKRQHI
jgi:hypothetical protein